MARLSWSVRAIQDLNKIAEYIAEQSPGYAPIYVERVVAAIEHLGAFPNAGRVIPELGVDELREIVFQNYRIAYWRDPSDDVFVLGVIHGAMDMRGQATERGWDFT